MGLSKVAFFQLLKQDENETIKGTTDLRATQSKMVQHSAKPCAQPPELSRETATNVGVLQI